jgi:hypothetical protein
MFLLDSRPHPARELILDQTAGCYLVSQGGHLVGQNFIGDSVALGGWVCTDFFEHMLDRKTGRRVQEESQKKDSQPLRPRSILGDLLQLVKVALQNSRMQLRCPTS